ncbi:MAG: hypothetical protein ACK5Q5_08015, partial [Planctomycetaceae bacterium]
MGRLLANINARLAESWRGAWAAWNRFWFTPKLPWSLGWLRLLSGGMLFYTHLVWGFAFAEFFGPIGWQDPLLVSTHQADSTAWSFWWLVPPEWQWNVHVFCLVIIAAYALGLWTRLTSWLSLAIAISYAHRAPLANFGLDQINILTCLYLCLAPVGEAISIDRLIVRFREAYSALRDGHRPSYSQPQPAAATGLAMRLLEVHMAILYLFAGLSKLKGDSWWDGNAIWLAAGNYEYQSNSLVWLCWHPWIVNLATHLTVLWESTFIFAVWKPRLRPLVLAAGVAMHIGIGLFLGMWTFGLAMIFTYVSYLPPEVAWRWQQLALNWRKPAPITRRYIPSSAWQLTTLALRCACDLRGTIQPVAVTPPPAPVKVSPATALSPGEWWMELRNQRPVWNFPAANDKKHSSPRLLVVRSYLRPLMELQEYFVARG